MKRIFMLVFTLMLCLLGQQTAFAEETVNIKSTITEVTVFPDRARVMRCAKIPYDKVKQLIQQEVTMARREQALEDQEERIEKEKKFLDNITAYLKARTVNKSPYPFLPGESTIFMDNTYITKSWLNKVAVGQEFWTFLGVDEGISVDYKIIDPFRQDKGVFKKKNILVYKRFITITYHKKVQRELVVWDQIPLSKDQAIKVELIEPRINGNRKDLVLTKRGFLEWLFKPTPGRKIEIPVQFTVQYPKDKALKGHTGF